MRLFKRPPKPSAQAQPRPEPLAPDPSRSDASEPPPPEPQPPPPRPEPGIRVSRTLVKSEPELAELIDSEPRLGGEGVEVSLTQKGFGTRVAIAVRPGAPLREPELEEILDGLAEPQKRPFSAG